MPVSFAEQAKKVERLIAKIRDPDAFTDEVWMAWKEEWPRLIDLAPDVAANSDTATINADKIRAAIGAYRSSRHQANWRTLNDAFATYQQAVKVSQGST